MYRYSPITTQKHDYLKIIKHDWRLRTTHFQLSLSNFIVCMLIEKNNESSNWYVWVEVSHNQRNIKKLGDFIVRKVKGRLTLGYFLSRDF